MSASPHLSPARARLCVLGCGLFWALDVVSFKRVLEAVPVETGICLRNLLIGALTVAVFASMQRDGVRVKSRAKETLRLSPNEKKAVLWSALLAGIIADLIFYWALFYAPVVNGLVLGHLQPFFVTILAMAALKSEVPTPRQFAGGVVMFIAALLVTSRDASRLANFQFGTIYDLIMLAAAVCWSVATLLTKKYMTKLPPVAFVFYRYVPAGVVLVPFIFLVGNLGWSWFLLPNATALFLGMCLYFLGLRALKASEVAFLELFSVFFGALLGWFMLGETTTLQQLAGMGALFFGVFLLSTDGKREILPAIPSAGV